MSFNAEQEATNVFNAFKESTEEQLTQILGQRTVPQRKEIAAQYKAMYGEDLRDKLKKHLKYHFEEAVLMSFRTKAEVNARGIYDAVHGLGTKEHVICQIMCPLNNHDMTDMVASYPDVLTEQRENPIGRSMEQDLKSDLSGDFERLIIAILQGKREESAESRDVKHDVEDLLKAGEGRAGTDESTFIKIFAKRSFEHLKLLNDAYKEKKGHDLVTAIKKETSGYFQEALTIIAQTAVDRNEAIAILLHDSMAGAGTHDSCLIRLVMGYSNDGMDKIKEAFNKKYGKPLGQWIREDTSGDYRKFLMEVIGESML